MITAVDTSVLLDVFTADAQLGRSSHAALTRCLREGSIIACEVVWAELASGFREEGALLADMDRLSVAFEPLDQAAALAAGAAWRRYREAGGSRQRILSDFLIGGPRRNGPGPVMGFVARARAFGIEGTPSEASEQASNTRTEATESRATGSTWRFSIGLSTAGKPNYGD